MSSFGTTARLFGLGLLVAGPAAAQEPFITSAPAQLRTDTPSTSATDWSVRPLFTVGEDVLGYRPPGIPDGIGATRVGPNVRLLVNHELGAPFGYPYTLANGTVLTGARVSFFDVAPGSRQIVGTGLAYHTVVDRAGNVVESARQLNEGSVSTGGDVALEGFDRFCSAALFEGGTHGLVDDVFFTGEETGAALGGIEYALDVRTGVLHAVPWLGRAAWENVALVDAGDPTRVALLLGDDTAPAPLYLYVGIKDYRNDGSFLDRNGLAYGRLYVWVADNGDRTPAQFRGTGQSRTGRFALVDHFQPALAGTYDATTRLGYDALGFASQLQQYALADAAGAFTFSRPEDLAPNPADGTQAVMASTGRGQLFGGVDNWGMTYVLDLDVAALRTDIRIVYDGNDAGAGQFANPDLGLRSPDNLDWASNGKIYVQEDRSVNPATLFGAVSGVQASVWELDPATGALLRIAELDQTALPAGQTTNPTPAAIGEWESSGVLDVTALFAPTAPGELVLVADVQAHATVGVSLGGANQARDLVEGGQLVLLTSRTGATGAAADDAPAFGLRAPAPNPAGGQTELRFSVAEAGPVRLVVYDALGREVARPVDGERAAGAHTVALDTSRLPSGTYLYRLTAGARTATERLAVVR